jgi:hypothetical protein
VVPPNTGNVQVVIDGNFYATSDVLPVFVAWPNVSTVIQSRVSQLTQAMSTSGTPAPTANENAAAILAAAQLTPIVSNVKQMNDHAVIGSGQPNDKWRG